ncbi:hypothetical protein V5O48_000027 [Marasmius crinis-equi]|uniref:Glycoside hydrolase family 125 protein n=1 Tax=Marasmius crinis-equi TaxID=585013 RepID=A0ABR3G2A4_9AGAR
MPRLSSFVNSLIGNLDHDYSTQVIFEGLDWLTNTLKFNLPITITTSLALGASIQCPNYNEFAQAPQGNPSNGTLALPFMRPAPACRTFNSTAVEKVIEDMKTRLKDPDVARLFENTFPNTLDTTVKYYSKEENLAFIITGDITAQWLRDTANQFAHYHRLLAVDSELAALFKAVINNEARYVAEYPYCGAFQPPPESGLVPAHNPWADKVVINPPVDNRTVFECKFELDSLAAFLKLSRLYYNATKDGSFMNSNWFAAIDRIFQVINEQSQSSFDKDFNFVSFYNWTGMPGALSPKVNNGGNGEPKKYTGMVGSSHRPSDDLCTFPFLVPANAMLSVELRHLADMLETTGQAQDVSRSAKEWSSRIHDAIWETAVVDDVFAYETNGFGGRYIMDDANVPSLLSLPYLGFLDARHPIYVATRKMITSNHNPYFAKGASFSGVGGPHADAWHPWQVPVPFVSKVKYAHLGFRPMSQISAIFGTGDDEEILESLYLIINNTAGLGLIHESQSIYNSTDYTRPWFAWANSYFAEMLLDLAERKPSLIFTNGESYLPASDFTAQNRERLR